MMRAPPAWPYRVDWAQPQSEGLLCWHPRQPGHTRTADPGAAPELIKDMSGLGRDAFYTNALGTNAEQTEIGTAYRVTTPNRFLALPDLSGLFGNNEATFMCWMKNDSGNLDSPFGLSTSAFRNHYPWSDNNLYIGPFRTDRLSLGSNTGVDKTKWHHVAITTKGGGSWRLYQNGIETKSAAAEATVTWSSTHSLMSSTRQGAYGYLGLLLWPSFHNVELSAGAIARAAHPDTRWTMARSIKRRLYSVPAAPAGGAVGGVLWSSIFRPGRRAA